MNKSIRIFLLLVCVTASVQAGIPPQATVVAPNGGENLIVGSEYTITWTCTNCAGNVIVEIYNTLHTGAGYSGQISLAGIPMIQGFYKWQAVGKLKDGNSLIPGPGYKIHLEAVDGSDASDGTFSIMALKHIHPKITLTEVSLIHIPDCPECFRMNLKPLNDIFNNQKKLFHVSLFANGTEVAKLGRFGADTPAAEFIDLRLDASLQDMARNRRGRFELRLFDAQGRLLQTQAVQLILLDDRKMDLRF